MTSSQDAQDMKGHTAVDADGAKLGMVGAVYLDDHSDEPMWIAISTGLLGTKENFAPLYGSRADGDDLRLAVSKDMVRDAPGIDANGHIGEAQNTALHEYYAGYLGDSTRTAGPGDPDTTSLVEEF
jgi:hypothetical protein